MTAHLVRFPEKDLCELKFSPIAHVFFVMLQHFSHL